MQKVEIVLLSGHTKFARPMLAILNKTSAGSTAKISAVMGDKLIAKVKISYNPDSLAYE